MTKLPEIRFPYPLPEMKNPLWILGLVAMLGSIILIHPQPHHLTSKADFFSFCCMILVTSVCFGFSLRCQSLGMALLVLAVPQVCLYLAIGAAKTALFGANPLTHRSSDLLAPFPSLRNFGWPGIKVVTMLAFFLVAIQKMRQHPAYDLTARLFTVSGIWLTSTTLFSLALALVEPFDYTSLFSVGLMNFAISILLLSLASWQNRKRASWYLGILEGSSPAWQFTPSLPEYGFVPLLFQFMHPLERTGVFVAPGHLPLATVALSPKEMFDALYKRQAVSTVFVFLSLIGLLCMAVLLAVSALVFRIIPHMA